MSDKIKLQEQYCKEKDAPFFAPKPNCWSCNRNIWDKITITQARTELITGCPYCNRSYVD